VIGFSSSFALAYYLQFRLTRLGKAVHWLFLTGGTTLDEQLVYLTGEDLLIAVGFLRAPRETRTAMDHARKVGAPMLGITDSATTPISKKADIYLLAQRVFTPQLTP
jgi:DNA-binding MurR/RpiR family transcriptional regulator